MQEKYKGVFVFEPTGKYKGSKDVLEMLAELRAKRSDRYGADDKTDEVWAKEQEFPI